MSRLSSVVHSSGSRAQVANAAGSLCCSVSALKPTGESPLVIKLPSIKWSGFLSSPEVYLNKNPVFFFLNEQ